MFRETLKEEILNSEFCVKMKIKEDNPIFKYYVWKILHKSGLMNEKKLNIFCLLTNETNWQL